MDTVWRLFECAGGSRWSSTYEDYQGQVCNFSGCNCNTVVRRVKETTDRDEAHTWFRRRSD